MTLRDALDHLLDSYNRDRIDWFEPDFGARDTVRNWIVSGRLSDIEDRGLDVPKTLVKCGTCGSMGEHLGECFECQKGRAEAKLNGRP